MRSDDEITRLCPFKPPPETEARMGSHQPRRCDRHRCAIWIGGAERGQCAIKIMAMSMMDAEPDVPEADEELPDVVDM
jgi:hypothetical protein